MKPKNQIFMRFLASYLLVTMVPVVILVGFMMFNFSRTLKQDFMDKSSELLSQTMGTVENKFDDIRQLVLKLPTDRRVSLYRQNVPGYTALEAVEQLDAYRAVNGFFVDIAVYIHGGDTICAASGDYQLRHFVMSNYSEQDYEVFHERLNNCTGPTILQEVASSRYITVLYPYPYIPTPYGTVVVLLDRTMVDRELERSMVEDGRSNAFMFDDRGVVVSSVNERHMQVCAGIASRIQPGSGSEYVREQGVRYLVTYEKSEKTGYTYMNIIPESSVTVDRFNWAMTMMVLLLVTFAVGAVVIQYFMRLNYSPIRKVVNKLRSTTDGSDAASLDSLGSAFDSIIDTNQQLKVQVRKNQYAMRRQLLQQLLCGRMDDLSELEEMIREIGINDSRSSYGVVLAAFDSAFNQKATVEDIHAADILEGIRLYDVDAMQPNVLIFILSVRSQEEGRVHTVLNRMHAQLERSTGLRATLGVGSFRQDIMLLAQSYVEANAALDWRFVRGKGGILYFAQLPVEDSCAEEYPIRELEHLSEDILRGDVDAIRQTVDVVVRTIRRGGMPLYMAKCLCYELINTIIRTVSRLHVSMERIGDSYRNAAQLVEYQTVDELGKYIVDICEKTCASILAGRESGNTGLRDRIAQYVEENYRDPNFSLESTADYFEMSYAYLSRFFKDQMGATFSDYISAKRMEYAKQLLTTTELSIAEIVQRIGYTNVSSFNRKFKAEVGITPGEWRKING